MAERRPMAAGRAAALGQALALLLALGLSLLAGPAGSAPAQPLFADPALEARVMAVAEGLRCVVCQNESLAASQADLARDLRAQIRQQLQAGRSPEEVVEFMVARYGQFVLYRPPWQASTWLLWVGPFALLVVAGWAWTRQMQRAARTDPQESVG